MNTCLLNSCGLWRLEEKKHYETHHVTCSTTRLNICPLTYLHTRYQPGLLTRSTGCTECPQKNTLSKWYWKQMRRAYKFTLSQ